MIQTQTNQPHVVGITPWLPWPLSASPWWTKPVRAERLALFRIGLAISLLIDIGYNYAPETVAYFATGGLGDPAIFGWYFTTDKRANWSLLRGVGDDPILYLALSVWLAMTVWIVGNSFARLVYVRNNPPPQDRTGIALMLWNAAFVIYVAGLWSQMIAANRIDHLAWDLPVAGVSLVCLFHALELATSLRDRSHRIPWISLLFTLAIAVAVLAAGYSLTQIEEINTIDKDTWWLRVLRPWQDDADLVIAAMAMWLGAAVLLLIGCCTRFAAIAVWMLSTSFASVNPSLDNAGDTIRAILLFYAMLCPCGAVWSVDALWRRSPGPVYVHPWPIGLLFVQMIFMYFMNGLYKVFGTGWLEGTTLFYVLGDLALARFSRSALPLTFEMTQFMTWSVLFWEVSFPLLVIWKWPRRIALFAGVMFHLGIFASMELGGFVPYALCMYLPLIPWEWWGDTKKAQG